MTKYSKEQFRRNNVLKAMRSTPMAKKIAIETNEEKNGEKKNEKIHD